jgi:4-hydroxybenzoate polyprenyltransferase
MPLLLSVVYYLLSSYKFTNYQIFCQVGLFLLSSIGFGFLGYLINDWTDIDENKRQGKTNAASSLSFEVRGTLLLLSITLAISPWTMLLFDKVTTTLLALQILSYMLYSVAPFRIKERGLWGVLLDAFYAHLLPTALVAYTFSVLYPQATQVPLVSIFFFVVWVTAIGVRNIIMHQLADFEADERAGVKTFASGLGKDKTIRFKNLLLVPLELIFLLLTLSSLPGLRMLAYLFPIYMLYVFYRESHRLKRVLREGGNVEQNRHDFFSDVVLNEFYEKWLPVILLLTQIKNPVFWLLLLAHVLLFAGNTVRFVEDLWFIFHVIVMQLKYLVWLLYHRLFLKILHAVYYPLKHVAYWHIAIPLKRVFNR